MLRLSEGLGLTSQGRAGCDLPTDLGERPCFLEEKGIKVSYLYKGGDTMRTVYTGISIAAVALSLAACRTTEPMTLAMILSGPATLVELGPPGIYTVVVGAGNKPPTLNFAPPTTPLFLEERDGTRMASGAVVLPPGVTSQTIRFELRCLGGRIGGSSNGTPRPAMVAVNFQGQRYNGSGGFMGNEISILCVPPLPR